jgi:protein ImuB
MLFGCIHVPDFPVQAALRSEVPDAAGKGSLTEAPVSPTSVSQASILPSSNLPSSILQTSVLQTSGVKDSGRKASFVKDQVAVLDGPANQMKVMACNEPARRAGIEIGMTKIQAEALPSVMLRKRVLDDEFVAQAALLECAGKFSPRLESTCPGTVVIDLTGTERLQGPRKTIAEKLRDSAEECGLSVNVALASNPDTAMLAARGMKGISVIPRGKEPDFLGDLPVGLLQGSYLQTAGLQRAGLKSRGAQVKLQAGGLQSVKVQSEFRSEEEIMDALNAWGIRDFKSLAALPSVALTQRLGQYGLHLQRLAKGEVHRELVPYVEASSFQASMELEESIELLEPLGFVLDRLLEQVVLQLINRSLATDRIQVDLELDIHSDCQLQLTRQQSAALEPRYQRVLKMPVPTQDRKIILKLLELDLAGKPPHAPVKKVSVEAFPARVKFGQTGLFQPVAPEPAKLEVTLARLRTVVGDKDEQGRALVGFPVILDSNRPDSFDVLPSMPSSKGKKQRPSESKSIVPRHAMRVLRPPAEVKVGLRARVPASISFAEIRGKVMEVSGPWRTSGSWWDQNQAWNREEWDVEVRWENAQWNEGHAIFRVFRDVASDRWYVEGIYA